MNGYPRFGWVDIDRFLHITYKDRNLKVKSVLSSTFSNNSKIETVTIENGIETIGTEAFKFCSSLRSVNIPNSVTGIGAYAFEGCNNIHSFSIPKGINIISEGFFRNCENLSDIEIPDNILEIGNYCFQNCKSLTKIKIPGNVKKIGDVLGYQKDFVYSGGNYGYNIGYKGEVFSGCINLKEVEIQEGVESIGSAAFKGCKNLFSVDIPNSVTVIGKYAFENCTSLRNVFISCNLEWMDYTTFKGDNSINAIVYKDGNKSFRCIDWRFWFQYPDYQELGQNTWSNNGFDKSYPKMLYIGRYFDDVIATGCIIDSLEILTIGKGSFDDSKWCYGFSSGLKDFRKAEHLKNIYSMSIDPEEDFKPKGTFSNGKVYSFNSKTYLNATLWVPIGTKEKYLEHDRWKNFFDIREMNISDMWNGTNSPITSNINSHQIKNHLNVYTEKGSLFIDNLEIGETISIYNCNGVLLYQLKPNSDKIKIPLNKGLYIVKSYKDVIKVVVK